MAALFLFLSAGYAGSLKAQSGTMTVTGQVMDATDMPLIGVNVTGSLFSILTIIKDIALLIGISFGAYAFARSQGKTWVIIFWVAFALYVVSSILGLF